MLRSIINLLFYADKWNIGFTKQSARQLIQNQELDKITWLQEEKSNYSADPFVVVINDIVYIYYEFLNFLSGKGKIYQIYNFDFKTRRLVSGFNPPKIHFSYPYIFEDRERFYCIPETAEAREIVLYEIDLANPSRVRRLKTLVQGAPYEDSSIIKYQNKYWLFTSTRKKPNEFLIFYSETPDGQYAAHSLNPIPSDVRSSRSAGNLFIDNGILYRPTQNGKLTYGGSIVIHRIKELTENKFESEFCFEISPLPPYREGIHTISFAENLIVIDGKRKQYSSFMLLKKLINKLRFYS